MQNSLIDTLMRNISNITRFFPSFWRQLPKNLKPPPSESWNTVSGKKMKKTSLSGQNFHSGRSTSSYSFFGRGMIVHGVVYNKKIMRYFWLLVTDVDYRGPKNSNKPVKAQSALPPRLQHPSGVRQHAYSSHSAGSQSQKPTSEHKNLRTPSQTIR